MKTVYHIWAGKCAEDLIELLAAVMYNEKKSDFGGDI